MSLIQYSMEINIENPKIKVNSTNAERVKKWKLNHREKYLKDKAKYNKYKNI